MQIYNIIAGSILLLFGRKLFWLFLGLAGFLFGMEMTPLFFAHQAQWLQLAIALGMGCLGAGVAILAQRLAFAVAGFFAGMYLALAVVHFIGLPDSNIVFLITFAAGLVGAILATVIMDEAITILACLLGAGAIVGELHVGLFMKMLAFVILAWAGFLFQKKILTIKREG
ncbi:hypothetical protein ACUUL3_04180 [Thiovibrio sp. JS02]